MAGDVKIAVVSRAVSFTEGGSIDFTKSGFGTPKACIVIYTSDGSVGATPQLQSRASIGFSDFVDDYCIAHQDESASAKVDCDAIKSNTQCFIQLDVSGTVIISGSASTVTDGVKLTTDFRTVGGGFATVIMFGGADLVASLDRTTINSSQDGTATITPGTGFDTSLIFFIGTDISGEDSANSGINNSFGVCHINAPTYDTFTQQTLGWSSDHNASAAAMAMRIHGSRVLTILTEAGTQDWALEVTAAATNSITVTTRDNGAGAGMEVYSLALDLDDRKSKVGLVDSPTSGTSWSPSVSLGFIPQYVGLGLSELVNSTSISTTNASVVGISSNTGSGEETCHSWYNEQSADPTNTHNLFRQQVLDLRDGDVSTVIQDHSHSSFDSGGWTTTINTENETTVRKWIFWAIEEITSGETNFETLSAAAVGVVALTPTLTAVRALAATALGVPVLARLKTILRALSSTAIGVTVLNRKQFLPLTSVAIGVPILNRMQFKDLSSTAVGVATLDILQVVGIMLNATAVGVATIGKQVSKFLAATAVGIPVILKKISFPLVATAVGVVALSKILFIPLSAIAVGVPTLVKQMFKVLVATAIGIATLAKVFIPGSALFFETLAATAVGIPALSRVSTRFLALAATAIGIASLIKNIKVTLAVTATGVVNLTRVVGKLLAATAVGVPSVAVAIIRVRALAVTAIGVPVLSLIRKITLAATAVGIAAIARKISLSLSVQATGIARLTKILPGGPIAIFNDWILRIKRRGRR